MLTELIKRDGVRREAYDPMKLIRWGQWGAKYLGDRIDWAKIVRRASEQLDAVSTTKELHDILILGCLAENTDAGQLMGGRLYAAAIHKEIYNDEIPTIQSVHKTLMALNLMDTFNYSDEEYATLNTYIDHSQDFKYRHSQLDQLRHKYALKNRKEKKEYESAQFVYMRMAMAVFNEDKTDMKLAHIKEFYHFLSGNVINAPTPNYINLGTPHRGLASCVLYTVDDTAPSIAAGNLIAETMTYMSAGIGGTMQVRSINDKVRGGSIIHQGKLPYYNATSAVVGSNKQAGRGGALTGYYSGYDPEAPVIAFLQNPRAPEKKKNRKMHFAMMGNAWLAHLAATGGQIMSFNIASAPDLWKLLFSGNIKKFINTYMRYEKDPNFPKVYVDATRFIRDAMQQSYEVGTHYMAFMDEINRHTPFLEPVHSSNLCAEITEPTAPFARAYELYVEEDQGYIEYTLDDGHVVRRPWSEKVNIVRDGVERVGYAGELEAGDGNITAILSSRPTPEVALCSLGGLVTPNITSDEQHAKAAYYTLRMIDYCIHRAHYELPNIGWTAKNRMNAGVGIVGLATHMARKNLKYDTPEGLAEIDRVMEDHSYFLIEASLKISKERGLAPWMHKTKWPQGWLPIDTYNRNVDKIVPHNPRRPWEDLRGRIVENGGIGHSALSALMPTESSSKGAGMPNGPYQIRALTLLKSDMDNVIDWVAPDSDLIGHQYQIAYETSVYSQINYYAVMQKWTDMAISADTYRDRSKIVMLSSHDLVQEYIHMARMGMKTRYYANVLTGSDAQAMRDSACVGGACSL